MNDHYLVVLVTQKPHPKAFVAKNGLEVVARDLDRPVKYKLHPLALTLAIAAQAALTNSKLV